MTVRVTISKANIYDTFGIAMVNGTTYTVEDSFGKSLIMSQAATDTDGIFSSTTASARGSDPYAISSQYPNNILASRSLTAFDNGQVLVSPTAAVTMTIQTGLPADFGCAFYQSGSGQVTVAAGTGVTLNNIGSLFKTGGQYGVVVVMKVGAETFVLTGDAA